MLNAARLDEIGKRRLLGSDTLFGMQFIRFTTDVTSTERLDCSPPMIAEDGLTVRLQAGDDLTESTGAPRKTA